MYACIYIYTHTHKKVLLPKSKFLEKKDNYSLIQPRAQAQRLEIRDK